MHTMEQSSPIQHNPGAHTISMYTHSLPHTHTYTHTHTHARVDTDNAFVLGSCSTVAVATVTKNLQTQNIELLFGDASLSSSSSSYST